MCIYIYICSVPVCPLVHLFRESFSIQASPDIPKSAGLSCIFPSSGRFLTWKCPKYPKLSKLDQFSIETNGFVDPAL